jgi:hypothetical protein
MKALWFLILVACLAQSTACEGNGEDPPASPSATTAASATASAADGACPVNPEACRLAAMLEAALGARDFAAVSRLNFISTVSCPGGRPSGPGGPFPLCEGAPAGEQRTGVGVARRYSEGAALSVPEYERFLRQFLEAVDGGASDQYGGGALDLAAVSCLEPAGQLQSCPRFTVVFSAILRPAAIPPLGTVPGRELLVFFFEDTAGPSRRITGTWTGIIQPDEGRVLFQTGGTLFDLGRVFVLN